ncbi:DUF6551 family protein [Aureimonas mangrovi]|uniref:DUF6551 family protein n=1 Tax=Aureimonas mangrovi TaxID=2758041 RepID=UPI00163D5735|nr:DUF6551 family protein [Aureimonas mangrovi]
MTALRPIQPIDIRGLSPRAPSSGAPIFEYVDPRTLWVDPAYQRSLSERSLRMLRKIIEGFDWTKLKPPVCALADDGAGTMTLRVIDGQHTAIAAASNPHVQTIPIMIVEAPDTRAQAEAFIGQNADRLGMTATQMHVAAVAAGDEEALVVARVAEAAAVTILRNPPGRDYKPGETVAVAAIAALIKKEGEAHAQHVLSILSAAGVAPIKADHIKAVDRLLTEAEFGALDADALASSIVAHTRFEKDAKTFAATHGLPLWKALAAVWFQKAKKRKGGAEAKGMAMTTTPSAMAKGVAMMAIPDDLARDPRPARAAWQPGNQIGRCPKCDKRYRGGPQARECADCAYGGSDG